DAGGLTTALSLEEQEQIEVMLVTHRHYDHIKDLVGLAHNNWMLRSLHVYCIDDVRSALQAHIFNDVLWPTMSVQIGPYFPITWHRVEPGVPFEVLGYHVTPIEMSHTVPTVGYYIERDGASFFYTADTRGDGAPSWTGIRPDLLIAETTMASANEQLAYTFGHMTPMSLGNELKAFCEVQNYYPKTVCVHINPHEEAQVIRELAALSQELAADITAGSEGMIFKLS
ncbi:MAG: MBL fold metallo-hydrolase, partial [Chloroflexia bacterium]